MSDSPSSHGVESLTSSAVCESRRNNGTFRATRVALSWRSRIAGVVQWNPTLCNSFILQNGTHILEVMTTWVLPGYYRKCILLCLSKTLQLIFFTFPSTRTNASVIAWTVVVYIVLLSLRKRIIMTVFPSLYRRASDVLKMGGRATAIGTVRADRKLLLTEHDTRCLIDSNFM